MRRAMTLLVLGILACAIQIGAAEAGVPAPPKAASTPAASSTQALARLPGETMEDAIPIPTLPFTDTGYTCDYADDYAVMCPYGNWAPDVVYAYTPEEETNIRISLCASLYDTALFLYHTEFSPYTFQDCNDDLCGIDGYRSMIEIAHVQPELTYYIVVDGYMSECGDFFLVVEDLGPCVPECGELWELEGEPDCDHGYEDLYNAGCHTYPPLFRAIEPSPHIIRICGSSGSYYTGGTPHTDGDWYEIDVENPGQIDVFCEAEFDCELSLIDGRGGCDQMEILDQDTGEWCEEMASVSADLPEGTHWIRVEYVAGTADCGLEYRLWIDGYTPHPMGVSGDSGDLRCQLLPPLPNPSSGTLEIRYWISEQAVAEIGIFDVSGRCVRTVVGELSTPGPGRITWDGRDDHRRLAPSGVYECRLTTATGSIVRPFLRIR